MDGNALMLHPVLFIVLGHNKQSFNQLEIDDVLIPQQVSRLLTNVTSSFIGQDQVIMKFVWWHLIDELVLLFQFLKITIQINVHDPC